MARISTHDLARAKDAVARLLEQLDLSAYLYDVEPADDGPWQVRIDCAAGEAWQSLSLSVDADLLLRSVADAGVGARILEEWRRSLAGCSVPNGSGAQGDRH